MARAMRLSRFKLSRTSVPNASTRRDRPRSDPQWRGLEALEQRLLLATFTVDSLADPVDPGKTTLRDVINLANGNSESDIIDFAVVGTIDLTRELPALSTVIEFEGPGAQNLTVRRDSGGDYRIFTITIDAEVIIGGMTISNGKTPLLENGGAIYNGGGLVLDSTIISGNSVPEGNGGGIFNDGNMTITNSAVIDNSAVGHGGESFIPLTPVRYTSWAAVCPAIRRFWMVVPSSVRMRTA